MLLAGLTFTVVCATFGITTTGMVIGRSQPVIVWASVRRGWTIPRSLVAWRFAVERCWCGGGGDGVTPMVGCGKEDLTLKS